MGVTALFGPMSRDDKDSSPSSRIRLCAPNAAADLHLLPKLHLRLSQHRHHHHHPSARSRPMPIPILSTPMNHPLSTIMYRTAHKGPSPHSDRTPSSLHPRSRPSRGGMVRPPETTTSRQPGWRFLEHLDQETVVAYRLGTMMVRLGLGLGARGGVVVVFSR